MSGAAAGNACTFGPVGHFASAIRTIPFPVWTSYRRAAELRTNSRFRHGCDGHADITPTSGVFTQNRAVGHAPGAYMSRLKDGFALDQY